MSQAKPKEERPAAAVTRDPRWARVVARDRTADGQFWYSVATTGVYCRPSCASRGANPKNVQLHDSVPAARAAGFRPCKRCQPDGPSLAEENAATVVRACRHIEACIAAGEVPTLDELASEVGLSASHFHRMFKAATGVTPKHYAAHERALAVRRQLQKGDTVTDAIHGAGFGSSGRFYESSTGMLGMTPTRYRAGGSNEDIRFAVAQSQLGAVLVASSGKGVAAITLGDDPEALVRDLQDRFPKARLIGADGDYEQLVATVIALVESPGDGCDLPLDVRGTAFQRRVWQALRKIPVGRTVTYAEVAAKIGAPQAARAVAGACAANPLAVAIPCHRVVRQDGAPSGYAWGVARKQALLAREAARPA